MQLFTASSDKFKSMEIAVAIVATVAALISAGTAAYTVYIQIRHREKPHLVLNMAYIDMHDGKVGVPVWYFRVVNIGTAPARNVMWKSGVPMSNHNGSGKPVLAVDMLMPGENFLGVGHLSAWTGREFDPNVVVTWRETPNLQKLHSVTVMALPDGAKEYGGDW